MKIFIPLIAILSLMACSPNSKQAEPVKGSIFAKMNISQLQTCSVSSPCSAGQSCTNYDNSGNSYCYAEGRESEVVGCTAGELVMMMSHPSQVGCD